MELIIDVGNTNIKCFLFENNKIQTSYMWSHSEFLKIKELVKLSNVNKCIISNVSKHNEIYSIIPSNLECIDFTYSTPIPLINKYETPHTLGIDRIVAAVGAETILPGVHKLIIDAGTAITIDLVTSSGEFIGGNISPGLTTRFNALHDYTGKLPKLEQTEQFGLTGINTFQAIQNGVIKGILYELEGYITEYNTIFPNISVFLTGGDTIFFEKFIKNPIFAEKNLNAIGLHRILTYNA